MNNQVTHQGHNHKRKLAAFLCVLISTLHYGTAWAQLQLGGPIQAAAPGRIEAPIDLTGTWVSLVTEDWAYRMLTPAPGDYMSVPVNDMGKSIADSWDLDADNEAGLQCKAFGAARIMRVPTRLKISWQDDFTLRIEADSGNQTRLLHFSTIGRRTLLSMMLNEANRGPTWQGYTVADWENVMINRAGRGRGGRRGRQQVDEENTGPPAGGTLKAITTQMRPGYLRANGIPYSENAILTEYFNRLTAPTGEEWFVVTTIVDDPEYLTQPYVTSSHFRRESDDSKWNLSPCETPAPPKGAMAPAF